MSSEVLLNGRLNSYLAQHLRYGNSAEGILGLPEQNASEVCRVIIVGTEELEEMWKYRRLCPLECTWKLQGRLSKCNEPI